MKSSLDRENEARKVENSPLDRKRKGRLLVGVVGILLSIGYTAEAQQLPFGTMDQPGAAIFPIVVGVGFGIASLLTIWEAWKTEAVSGSVELPADSDRKRLLGLVLAFVAYILALPFLGQILASTAFAIAALRLLSELSWLRVLLYGLGMSGATYVLFVVLLNVRMPSGFLSF